MPHKSTVLFQQIQSGVAALPDSERTSLIKKVNGIFEMNIKNSQGEIAQWTLDFKKSGSVTNGKSAAKPDIVITMDDEVFIDLSSGKLNGQKAFMQGKLKVKGNMMLATKLDTVLQAAKKSAPAAKPAPEAGAGGVSVPGFESSKVFSQLNSASSALSQAEKDANVKKVKAVFQFDVKNKAGTVQIWTLDLKNDVSLKLGAGKVKPDIIIAVGDEDMVSLADGKLNGQKAFMQGKIKVKGNMMLATKLDGVLKSLTVKAKL